ncbi:MAG: YraN family protein [Chitinophagaceae bacterium]|nr:MAG: YraN family protein [Chitinophagaceae bacterium]
MAAHNESGRAGEALARTYFQQLGYTILHSNWRFGHLEVDVIAEHGGMLHFIEVKYRSGGQYGPPESAVNRQKFNYLARAAAAFLEKHPQYRDLRFDILAIRQPAGAEPEYFLIEDVFL